MQQQLEAISMTGGHGPSSYARNSSLQGLVANFVKGMIEEAITEKLDIESFPTIKTFNITDLGCSVGPNTFQSVAMIMNAVKQKYASLSLSSYVPEFQVFFNDHSSNDFNTLFESFPPNMQYYSAGVPGSFHGRLFPESSLHFVYSSYALHWLSKVPKEVLDKDSPAWNKGRIIYIGGPKEVMDAYSGQFGSDISAFLNARAKEMVESGIMALLLLGSDDQVAPTDSSLGLYGAFLGSVLMDMASEGIIDEDKVDSFNLPLYAPTSQEFQELVEINGLFSIEQARLIPNSVCSNVALEPNIVAMHAKAATEQMIGKYFGSGVVEEAFQRFMEKVAKNPNLFRNANVILPALFVLLKRKAERHSE